MIPLRELPFKLVEWNVIKHTLNRTEGAAGHDGGQDLCEPVATGTERATGFSKVNAGNLRFSEGVIHQKYVYLERNFRYTRVLYFYCTQARKSSK
jgi:hypothetical protein